MKFIRRPISRLSITCERPGTGERSGAFERRRGRSVEKRARLSVVSGQHGTARTSRFRTGAWIRRLQKLVIRKARAVRKVYIPFSFRQCRQSPRCNWISIISYGLGEAIAPPAWTRWSPRHPDCPQVGKPDGDKLDTLGRRIEICRDRHLPWQPDGHCSGSS